MSTYTFQYHFGLQILRHSDKFDNPFPYKNLNYFFEYTGIFYAV